MPANSRWDLIQRLMG